jgi:hypothetical protein
MCLDTCQQHLDHYGNEYDAFLTDSSLVMKDGSIIVSWQLNGRVHNESIHNQQPRRSSKSRPYTGKLMLTVLWGSQGSVLEHYWESRTTTNSAHYSEMLSGRLQPTIWRKR